MIVGLSGYARSGKDTVAEYLVDNYGFKRVAFADAIKDALLAINPHIPNLYRLDDSVELEGWEVAKLNPYVRSMLQALGVYARDNWGENFWIDQAVKKIDSLRGENYSLNNVVITDVRFPNEYDAISNWTIAGKQGVVVRVSREGIMPVNNHVSEIALDNHQFKHTIHNDSDLFDLHLSIENLMRELGVEKE